VEDPTNLLIFLFNPSLSYNLKTQFKFFSGIPCRFDKIRKNPDNYT
jgi:hypothetical protein